MDVIRKRAQVYSPAAVLILILTAMASLIGASACSDAAASTYRVLHTFCSKPYCDDGKTPYGGLTMDAAGNLYGTTGKGGRHDSGTVFELEKIRTGWKYQVLYSFCARTNCSDGNDPWGNLILDVNGNLYGTTRGGTIFKLSPNADKSRWKIHTLYTFCSKSNCTDGDDPTAGLSYSGQSAGVLYDGRSPLFGTTQYGGTNCQNEAGCGTVFELNKHAVQWQERVLYNFCSQGGSACTDGNDPVAPLLVGKKSLYGTTLDGGNNVYGGVVFELVKNNTGGWSETVPYAFCALQNCSDGTEPWSGLIMDASGNLDGTTSYGGGSGCIGGYYCGVIFQLAPDGTETVLHDFCSGSACVDGSGPFDTLTSDVAGNLYGTTLYEGSGGGGTIFKLGNSFSVLYNFCSQSNCADGEIPYAPVIIDSAGNLYGTTTSGGNAQLGGVVFELTP